MRAAVLIAQGEPLELSDVDIDTPRLGEVVVEVRASGICHSDVAAATKVSFPDPVVLGHEVAGVVVDVGPGVTDVAVGDHVVACELRSCGRCDDCIRGRSSMCTRPDTVERPSDAPPRLSMSGRRVMPFSRVGGFAPRILIHENNLVVIDRDLPFDVAAVTGCAVVTGAGAAINTAAVRVGDTVAVIGCGGVGLSAIACAAIAGARRVIAVDVVSEKLELARVFGATDVVDAGRDDPVEVVRRLTDGIGVLHAFECVGSVPTTFQALRMAREMGNAHLIGFQPPETMLELRPFSDLLMPRKSLRMVYMGSTTFRYDIPLYLDLWRQGRFPIDRLVGRRIALGEVNEAIASAGSDGVAKTVITSF